jgi:hypothetical protein
MLINTKSFDILVLLLEYQYMCFTKYLVKCFTKHFNCLLVRSEYVGLPCVAIAPPLFEKVVLNMSTVDIRLL